MPVESGLEFMPVIGADGVNAEGELPDEVINEVNRVCLIVTLVHFEGADSCRVIYRSVLVTPHGFARGVDEVKELNVNLNMVTGHALLVSPPVLDALTSLHILRQSVNAVSHEYITNGTVNLTSWTDELTK